MCVSLSVVVYRGNETDAYWFRSGGDEADPLVGSEDSGESTAGSWAILR